MTLTLDPIRGVAEAMMRQLAPPPPKPARKWATPGDLAVALDPTTVQTPALELIDQELVRLADPDSGVNRLMVYMPPQEGKSVRTSQRFVEWLLTENPELRVAIVSYSDEMARRWGGDIKLDAEVFNGDEGTVDLGIKLRADSKAAGRWQILGHLGGVYCTGIGGGLTGKAVDVLVIDDPLKNLEEAQSSKFRNRFKRFWRGVCIPRLGPGSICVLIQTRWHEDDPGGWLLKRDPTRWRVVSIPAIAGKPMQVKGEDGQDHEVWIPDGVDPLGRAPGEAMASARGDRDWQEIREDVGEYVWNALYQQRPNPAEGGLFKRAKLRRWHSMPADFTRHGVLGGQRVDLGGRTVYLDDCWRFLTIDLAASTKTSADYTAVGVWAISNEGDLIMLDGNRDQIGQDDHWGLVRPLREKWAADTVFVESRMFGTTLVYEAGRNGIPVQELHADTDKFTRALPAAARAGAGRLWLPAGEGFVTDVVDELVAFPNATNDDYVDVVAYAARVVAAHWVPALPLPDRAAKRDEGAIGSAYEASTGAHPNGMNYMDIPM